MLSFFLDTKTVPDFEKAWERSKLFVFTFNGIVDSVPLIIFAYMYQVNIPQIYLELTSRNYKTMSRVVYWGTFLAVICYMMIGIFGYLTFDDNPYDKLKDKNILMAPYINNIPILAGNFAILFAVITAAPLVVLPCKDSIEELRYKDGMTPKQNLVVTFLIVFVSMLLALVIPGIGYAITLAGCTTNPIIGFFVPIIFYHKATPDEPLSSPKKIISIIVFVVIAIASVLGFYNFILSLIDHHNN
jgi:amino acid permease